MTEINIAKQRLKYGEQYPYDGNYNPVDWAHRAANAILFDLNDRRGIKEAFYDLSDEVCKDIVETAAEIIREAFKCSEDNPENYPCNHISQTGKMVSDSEIPNDSTADIMGNNL